MKLKQLAGPAAWAKRDFVSFLGTERPRGRRDALLATWRVSMDGSWAPWDG